MTDTVRDLPDGIVAVVTAECPTCALVTPVLSEIAAAGCEVTVVSQDGEARRGGVTCVIDDSTLDISYRLGIETVPTLIRIEHGREQARAVGWQREEWQALTGVAPLGASLPEWRPGCGSRTVQPAVAEELMVRFGRGRLRARRVELATYEDDVETMFDRGWSDGLPLVPPTEARVLRMLEGTTRAVDEVVGVVPPNAAPCTVEKVAINAVMAGCKPEYLPVVLAAVEAACTDAFNMHGVLATTWFVGPVVIVNGPIATAIGMNAGVNVLGQGNRANATIGRALQLVIRNVGGGRPGEVDRATFGNPGKYTFCFAEDEQRSPWEPLAVERGVPSGASAVTLFAGEGVRGVLDQLSRTPESLARSLAGCLHTITHPKIPFITDALVVVSPEHGRVFREAGWTKERLREEILGVLTYPGRELVRGAGGIAEGLPEHLREATFPKFRSGGLHFVHAGGGAGLFSAIIGGWPMSGDMGSTPVTKEIQS